MSQEEELEYISKKLILFLNQYDLEKEGVYATYNNWVLHEGINISYDQNVQWCFRHIKEYKKQGVDLKTKKLLKTLLEEKENGDYESIR